MYDSDRRIRRLYLYGLYRSRNDIDDLLFDDACIPDWRTELYLECCASSFVIAVWYDIESYVIFVGIVEFFRRRIADVRPCRRPSLYAEAIIAGSRYLHMDFPHILDHAYLELRIAGIVHPHDGLVEIHYGIGIISLQCRLDILRRLIDDIIVVLCAPLRTVFVPSAFQAIAYILERACKDRTQRILESYADIERFLEYLFRPAFQSFDPWR